MTGGTPILGNLYLKHHVMIYKLYKLTDDRLWMTMVYN
jgi:hypothetical protein